MSFQNYKGEVRDSTIRDLLNKVKKQNYKNYLASLRLEKIRVFQGGQVNFDFPVTALIGPNGGGKSTILGASGCIYTGIEPQNVFRKSRIGDESMQDWKVEFELIDKGINPKGTVRADMNLRGSGWFRSSIFTRSVRMFGINRTVPASENYAFPLRKKLTTSGNHKGPFSITTRKIENTDHIKREAERILGKSLSDFDLIEATYTVEKPRNKPRKQIERTVLEDGTIITKASPIIDPNWTPPIRSVTQKQIICVGGKGDIRYSEFNFGAGEASVIRMVADIESEPENALILIEEIENGLHPLAVRRMVEYLIEASKRKGVQVIFTTHSDYALAPLPSEAIWAAIDGRLQQGKLSIEVLRAVSGRVDKQLAIFVEDDFAKSWVEAIVREKLGASIEEVGIYPVYGDGNAVKTHLGHVLNPSISFRSLCLIDGDSGQTENHLEGIFCLPGSMPETTIFDSVLNNLENNVALLTVACQRPLSKQDEVARAVREVSHTNRDPHLLFGQLGAKLGFIPEATVRGAFLAIWIQENANDVESIGSIIRNSLETSPK